MHSPDHLTSMDSKKCGERVSQNTHGIGPGSEWVDRLRTKKVTDRPTDSSGQPPNPQMIIRDLRGGWTKSLGRHLTIPESQPLFRWSRIRPIQSNQFGYVVMTSDGFIGDTGVPKLRPKT